MSAIGTNAPATPDCALRLADVHKSFGLTPIIRGVSLDIAKNERHAIIGPNGAGKSTLFNLVSGRFAPTRGSILLNGVEIAGKTPYRINRCGLARSFQVTNIFPRLTVYENIRCSVFWSLGCGYSFWRSADKRADATRTDRRRAGADRHDGPPRHAGGRAHLRRAARARDRHHHRRRRQRDHAGRADGRHEPRRDGACGRADPLGHPRQDAGDGRARHGRGVRSGRPDLGARLRRGHRHRHAESHSREQRPCRKRTSAPATMLETEALHAYYGKSHILHGVSLTVRQARS